MTEDERVCLTSCWFLAPGTEEKVLTAIQNELVPEIQAKEPGTLTYFVHRPHSAAPGLQSLPPSSDRLLLFYEEYASPQAFREHLNGPTFTGFVKAYGDCFLQASGKPYTTVTFLSRKAGFARGTASPALAVGEKANANQHPAVMFEVLANDHAAARAFYSEVFNWSYQTGTNDFGYIHFPAGSPPLLGGIGQATPGEPGMSPGTNFYLLVNDLQATLDRAIAAGGEQLMPPVQVDGYHFAMFTDPEGFAVGLITPFGP